MLVTQFEFKLQTFQCYLHIVKIRLYMAVRFLREVKVPNCCT